MVKERETIRQAPKKQTAPVFRELTLDELEDEINLLSWEHGQEKFEITEIFSHKKKSLLLDSLTMELDYPYVVFSDYDNLISENRLVSMLFLDNQVKKITKETVDSITKFKIVFFDDCTIEIQ